MHRRHVAPMLVVFLAMQAVPGTVAVVTPADPATANFDLAKAKPSDPEDRCSADRTNDDILICGRKKAMDMVGLPEFSERPVRAAKDIKGLGRVSAEGESRDVGGFTSKAAMVKLRIGF